MSRHIEGDIMALGSYPCWSCGRESSPLCTAHHLARPAHPLLARLLGRRPSFVHSTPWIPPTHCARSRRSSKTTGATTRSRSLAFPVTAYGASHRGAGPSSSPFVTFTLKMPVALPYPRMLSMLLGSISPSVLPHGALSCTPVAHTLAHRPPPLRALLILFWRGCLAAG